MPPPVACCTAGRACVEAFVVRDGGASASILVLVSCCPPERPRLPGSHGWWAMGGGFPGELSVAGSVRGHCLGQSTGSAEGFGRADPVRTVPSDPSGSLSVTDPNEDEAGVTIGGFGWQMSGASYGARCASDARSRSARRAASRPRSRSSVSAGPSAAGSCVRHLTATARRPQWRVTLPRSWLLIRI